MLEIPPREQKFGSRELVLKTYIKPQQLKSEAREAHLIKNVKQKYKN